MDPQRACIVWRLKHVCMLQAAQEAGGMFLDKFVLHGLLGAASLPLTALSAASIIDSAWAVARPRTLQKPLHACPPETVSRVSYLEPVPSAATSCTAPWLWRAPGRQNPPLPAVKTVLGGKSLEPVPSAASGMDALWHAPEP